MTDEEITKQTNKYLHDEIDRLEKYVNRLKEDHEERAVALFVAEQRHKQMADSLNKLQEISSERARLLDESIALGKKHLEDLKELQICQVCNEEATVHVCRKHSR